MRPASLFRKPHCQVKSEDSLHQLLNCSLFPERAVLAPSEGVDDSSERGNHCFHWNADGSVYTQRPTCVVAPAAALRRVAAASEVVHAQHVASAPPPVSSPVLHLGVILGGGGEKAPISE